MAHPLSKLESRMEALIEGAFARLFAGRVHPRDVALRLARALEDTAGDGVPAVRYTVRLNPADAQDLLNAHPDLARILSTELLHLARDARLILRQPPEVILLPEPGQPPHTVQVTTEDAALSDTATLGMPPAPAAPAPILSNAFVILDGERTVALRQAVVSIGRRFDNHIILDDPRVSRAHAQLRLRFGRFVVYDLGSTGGTFVNGRRVEECVLRPGDVISLGGVTVIYGEDAARPASRPARPAEAHGTRPMPPQPPTLPPQSTDGQ
jgi:hypothetical protein